MHTGDARVVLPQLPDESVHCCVTSPPYWGLRDYGCEGQVGLENSLEEYISTMVGIFAEVKRVLRNDGTLWLNLGDSYNSGNKGNSGEMNPSRKQATNAGSIATRRGERLGGQRNGGASNLCKPKDLCGIPWRVAFALQADGWYLRSDIIWAKPNPMPESVTDRPTKSHEYIFLLSKSERYYYDAEAIKEAAIYGDVRKPFAPGQIDYRGNGHDRGGGKVRESVKRGGFAGKTNELEGREAFRAIEDWRNKRSVWTVATQPFPEVHFATFPEDLIKPCILAGCPAGGTVLDPFFGSGTTGLVATRNNCKCIGIELNADYVEIAKRRLSQNVLDFSEAK